MAASNRLSGTPDDIVNSFAKDLNVESPSGSTTAERITNLIASVHAEITRSPEQYNSVANTNTLGELHAFAGSLGGIHSAAQEMLNQSLQTVRKEVPTPTATPTPQVLKGVQAEVAQLGQTVAAEKSIPIAPEVPELASELIPPGKQAPVVSGKPVTIAPEVPLPPMIATEKPVPSVPDLSESLSTKTTQLVTGNQTIPKQGPLVSTKSPVTTTPQVELAQTSQIVTESTSVPIIPDTPESLVAKSVQLPQQNQPLAGLATNEKVVPNALIALLQQLKNTESTNPAGYEEQLQQPATKVAVSDALRQLVTVKILEDESETHNLGQPLPLIKGSKELEAKLARFDDLIKLMYRMNPALPTTVVAVNLVELLLINFQYIKSIDPIVYSNALNDSETKKALTQTITKHVNKLTSLEQHFLQHPFTQEQWKEYRERRSQLNKLIEVMKEANPSFDPFTISDAKYLLPADAVGLIQGVHCGLELSPSRVNQLFSRNDVAPGQSLLFYVKDTGLVQDDKGEENSIKITRHTIEPVLQELRDPVRARSSLSRQRINEMFPEWKISI